MAINWDAVWKQNTGESRPAQRSATREGGAAVTGAIDWDAARARVQAEKKQEHMQEVKTASERRREAEAEQQRQKQARIDAGRQANKLKTLPQLMEGYAPEEAAALYQRQSWYPAGGSLVLSDEEKRALGMVNENGFVYGGVQPESLGMSRDEFAQLVGAEEQEPQPDAGRDEKKVGRWERNMHSTNYPAGMFAAGMMSQPASILAGAKTALGDAVTGGRVSDDMQKLEQYFAENPDALRRWMAGENGAAWLIAQETGIDEAAMSAYKTAYFNDWMRGAVEDSFGAGVNDKFKNTVGNWAYTIGAQVPGLIYSGFAAPGGGESGGIVGSVIDAARNKAGVVDAASKATVDALKGNVATWLIGAGSTGGKITELARTRGYDPKQYLTALGNGFAEYFTEGLFGISDAASIQKIWDGADGTAQSIAKAIGQWLMSGAEEGLEEFVNVPMSRFADRITDKSIPLVGDGGLFDIREMVRNGVDGAIVGLLMGSVGAVTAIDSSIGSAKNARMAAEQLNRVIEFVPERVRPEPMDVSKATPESVQSKETEVLQALETVANEAMTQTKTESPQGTENNGRLTLPTLENEPAQPTVERGAEANTAPVERRAVAEQTKADPAQAETETTAPTADADEMLEQRADYQALEQAARRGELAGEEEYNRRLAAIVRSDPALERAYTAQYGADYLQWMETPTQDAENDGRLRLPTLEDEPAQPSAERAAEANTAPVEPMAVTQARDILDEFEGTVQLTETQQRMVDAARETVQEWENSFGQTERTEQNDGTEQTEQPAEAGADPAVRGQERESAENDALADRAVAGGGQPRAAAQSQSKTAAGRSLKAEQLRLKPVSTKSLGLENGTDRARVTVYPREAWDAELTQAAKALEDKGYEVQFVLGALEFTKPAMLTDGCVVGDKVIVRANSMRHTATELCEHERFHTLMNENPGASAMIWEKVDAELRDSRYDRLVEQYVQAYLEAYEGDEARIQEELMADAYAGLNRFGEMPEVQRMVRELAQQFESGEAADLLQGQVEPGVRSSQTAREQNRTRDGTRFSYLGPSARTANLQTLQEAQEMQKAGADMESIRKATGWHQFADGKWRWEIDDSGAETDTKWNFLRNPDAKRYNELFEKAYLYDTATAEDLNELQILDKNLKGVRKSPLYLDEIVKHDKLFEAYPALRDVKVRFEANTGNVEGAYHDGFNEIVLRAGLKLKPEKLKDTLIHEIQHAIQKIEGFAGGASPEYWNERMESGYSRREHDGRIERADKEYRRIFDSAPEEFKRKVREINRARLDGDYDAAENIVDELYDGEYADLWSKLDMADFERRSDRGAEMLPSDLYRNTAGEIEARDAAARRNLTAEQRQETAPAYGDENTVFADGGESYSIRNTKGIPYQKQIDAFYDGDSKTVGRSDDIYIADADNSLSSLGIGEKPFFMLKSNLRKSTRVAGNNPSNSAHGISESVIRKLPELIKSPALIVQGDGRISIIPGITVKTEKNNTAPLLIAVNPNGSVDGIDAYEIKSIYGRENFANWLDLRARDSKIIAGDGKKAAALLRDVGKQYPEPVAYAADLTNAILSQSQGGVKYSAFNEEVARQLAGEDRGKVKFSAEDTTENPTDDPDIRYPLTPETTRSTPVEDSNGRQLTDAQREFFRDSKVVDGEGRLLTMYHGTNADKQFTVFNTYGGKFGLFGRGSYFTDNADVALSYTGKGKGTSPRVYEVYLNITNPIDMDAAFDPSVWADMPADIRDAIKNSKTNEDMFRSLKQYCEDEEMVRWEAEEFITDTILSAGYDGITHIGGGRYGSKDGPRHRVYIAIEPEQIKSVANETPTSNPDIRYSLTQATEGRKMSSRTRRDVNQTMNAVQTELRGLIEAETRAARDTQKQVLSELAQTVLDGKNISQEQINDAFETVWNAGRVVDRSAGEAAWDVKEYLRTQGVALGEADQANFTDWNAFRRSNFGRLRISKDGTPVDVAYGELNGMSPGLFPADIVNPADQLERMASVAESLQPKEIGMDSRYSMADKGQMMSQFVDMVQRMEQKLLTQRTPSARPQETQAAADETKEFWDALQDWMVEKAKRDGSDAQETIGGEDYAPEQPTDYVGMADERNERLRTEAEQREAQMREELKARAMQMKKEGIEPGEILIQTQWYVDSNGEWRHWDDLPTKAAQPDSQGKQLQEAYLQHMTRDGFKGTEALDKLGVKVAGSVANYRIVDQLIENAEAAKAVRRDIRKAERRLNASQKEKAFASSLAAGVMDETDIPASMDRNTVLELADYYILERGVARNDLRTRRNEMYAGVDREVQTLMRDREAYHISSAPVMMWRTPQRSMIRMFGREQGQKIYDYFFAPVAANEAERYRWVNRMYNEVREVEGSDGTKKPLTQKERALTQMLMEGKAVEEMAAQMEERQTVYNAAENLRKGAAMEDVAKEFGLSRELRDTVRTYAEWVNHREEIYNTDGVDVKRIENAAKLYAEKYDQFYAAINDFLVAHGYEPIGFIRGYAPHIQPETQQTLLQKALSGMGLSDGVTTLPASIAGRTSQFRPNKRWNPFFQSRNGDTTVYDVTQGYERYVDYLSDILYHTDDIVRIRRASDYFRRTYAPQEISETLSWAEFMRDASPARKAELLQDEGVLDKTAVLTSEGVNQQFEQYLSDLYGNLKEQGKYSNFVNWLEDYANGLAGKQSVLDRSFEMGVGRTAMNLVNKVTRAFQTANVAGNLSSVLNQSSQLPNIIAENGTRHTAQAIRDAATGRLNRDGWRERSDFLAGKKGIDKLIVSPTEKVVSAMFKPAEVADYMMSCVAVRSAYLKALSEGMSDADAMRYADRKAEQIMGSRMKGSAPQAFRSKNPVVKMLNMFQTEALNSFEHVEQDLIIQGIRDIKAIDNTQGRRAAAKALVATLAKTILAAFLLNRATDELYGGTPAQYDLLGYAANFVASGNGITANQQIVDWLDTTWKNCFGERLFDEPEKNETFDWNGAMEGLAYDVNSDLPLVRNMMGLLGLGDQSLPMPDFSKIGDAVKATSEYGLSAGPAWLAAAGEFVPGGRQLNKTAKGAAVMAKGGSYSEDGKRLRYPVEDSAWNWGRALLFGPSALRETDAYYARGGGALSGKETTAYQDMVEAGVGRKTAYRTLREVRQLTPEDGSDSVRDIQKWELIAAAGMSESGKLAALSAMMNDSQREKLLTATDYGVTAEQYVVFRRLLSDAESQTQEAAQAAIDQMDGLTKTQKAVLWQLANKAWKAKKNPYSTKIGAEITGE